MPARASAAAWLLPRASRVRRLIEWQAPAIIELDLTRRGIDRNRAPAPVRLDARGLQRVTAPKWQPAPSTIVRMPAAPARQVGL
jgi:hypothetical protein